MKWRNTTYTKWQKKEPSLLHTYALNEFLTTDHLYTTKYLWKDSNRSWLLTSFRFFWHILRSNWSVIRVTAQWDFKLSEKFEIDLIFLQKQRFYRFRTFFKDSLSFQKLTNLNVKGAKRSVKMRATNFYKSCFRNILCFMNGRRSNIRLVHTYGVS